MKTTNFEKGQTYSVVTSRSFTRSQENYYEANKATFNARLRSGKNWFSLSDGTDLYLSDAELMLGELPVFETPLAAGLKAAELNTERAIFMNEQAIKYHAWLKAKAAEAAEIWGDAVTA